MDTAPTVFLVDDDEAVRKAFSFLFQSAGIPVKTFASAEDYLIQYNSHQEGVLLLDIRLPGTSGLELLHTLETLPGHPPIIMISGYGDVPSVVDSFRHGAIDFIEKPCNHRELLYVVRKAIHKQQALRESRERYLRIRHCLESLNPKERQVLDRIRVGKLHKVIAEELGISEKTVEYRRRQIMKKMGVPNLTSLLEAIHEAE